MTTEELLLQAKDIDIDLTIKLFLLFVMAIYLVAMLYFSKVNDNDRYYQLIIKIFFMKIPSIMLLFYFPLNALYLYREVAAETLLFFVASFYAIYTTLFIGVMVAFGTDFLFRLVGIDMGDFKKMKRSVKQMRFKQ